MLNPQLLEEVKLQLNKHTVASILNHIGYEVDRSFKFKLRDENTPSASIRIDGYIVDFGGDFRGDIFSLIQEYHEMNFVEAVAYVATCVGVAL